MKTSIDCFVVSVRNFEPTILIKGVHLTNIEKGVHIVNLKEQICHRSYASGGIRTRNPWALRLLNTCAIGCAKKTAENAFKYWPILTHNGRFLQVLADSYKYWPILTSIKRLIQVLADSYKYWPILTSIDGFLQVLSDSNKYWYILTRI